MTEFTIISFVCFIQAAEYGVDDLFMPARLRALTEDGKLRDGEGVLVPLPSEMRADILMRGLLHLISDCIVDPVNAILAFAHACEVDWSASDSVGWFLYDFADAAIVSVPEWQSRSLKRGLRGHTLPGLVRTKVVPRYVDGFRDDGMSRDFAGAVWARYKADGVDLHAIASIEEQRAFVRDLNAEVADEVPEPMDEEEDNWDFEGMVSAEDVASSGIRGKLQEVQHICEDGGEAVPTTVVEVIE